MCLCPGVANVFLYLLNADIKKLNKLEYSATSQTEILLFYLGWISLLEKKVETYKESFDIRSYARREIARLDLNPNSVFPPKNHFMLINQVLDSFFKQ